MIEFYIADAVSGEERGRLFPATFKFNDPLYGGGELSMSIAIPSDPSKIASLQFLTVPDRCAVYVIDSGVVLYNGVINWRLYSPGSNNIEIRAQSWRSWLYTRVYPSLLKRSNYDQYQMAYDLVDFAANSVGAPSLLRSTELSGVLREFTVNPGWSIGEALDNFSSRDGGFEWNITARRNETEDGWDRIFEIWPVGSVRRNPILLRLDSTIARNNIAFGNVIEDGTSRRSRIWAMGDGIWPDVQIVSDEDPDLQNGDILLREDWTTWSGVTRAATLFDHARSERIIRSIPITEIKASHAAELPSILSYAVGDRAHVTIKDPWMKLDESGVRIIDRTITQDDAGVLTSTVTLDLLDIAAVPERTFSSMPDSLLVLGTLSPAPSCAAPSIAGSPAIQGAIDIYMQPSTPMLQADVARQLVVTKLAAVTPSTADISSAPYTYTFSGCDLGTADPTRYIVVCAISKGSAYRTINSMTVAGIAAPIIKSNPSYQVQAAIGMAAVPSGTSGDVTVTISGSALRCGIQLYSIVGSEALEVVDTDYTTNNTSCTVDVRAGGVVIASGSKDTGTGTTASWTNITHDSTLIIESLNTIAVGHKGAIAADGTLTTNPTWNNTTNTPQNLAVSIGPGDPTPTPTRDEFEWPWDAASPWNVGISSTAQYETSSDTMTAAFLNGSGSAQVNWDYYSIAVYLATTSDPQAQIINQTTGTNYGTYYVPASATAPLGTDKNVVVVQPDGVVVDIYKFTRDSVTPNTKIYSTSTETNPSIRGSGLLKGIRAADISLLGGVMRTAETAAINSGTLECFPHAIGMAFSKTILGGPDPMYVWPAHAKDNQTYQPYSGSVPMGTLFAIPATVDLSTISGLSTYGNLGMGLAKSLQRYGAYVIDQADTKSLQLQTSSTGSFRDTLKSAWTILLPYMRVVKNNTESTPGGGPAPRLAPTALPFA